jgi:amino acid transporter
VPLVAIPLAAGALAGMLAWFAGPSEGPLRIGREQGFLPPFFQKVNRNGIEMRILAGQAMVITVIALLYAFIPDVSHAYWVFAVMATQIYLIMYVLMFAAAVRLRRKHPDHARGYRAPALGLLCFVGAVSSVAALVIGFIAPSQFGHLNRLLYAPPDPGRDTRHRDRSAFPRGSASQTGVEDHWQRAHPRTPISPPPRKEHLDRESNK